MLLDQRYRPTYGPLPLAELQAWRRRCSPAARAAAAARRPSLPARLEAVRAAAAEKVVRFARLAAELGGGPAEGDELLGGGELGWQPRRRRRQQLLRGAAGAEQAADVAALMMADEVELTVGLLLGDAAIYGFAAGCVAAAGGEPGLAWVTAHIVG